MHDLYRCNADDSARFLLGRSGCRMLFVLGLNPSTATRGKADMTIAKTARIGSKRPHLDI